MLAQSANMLLSVASGNISIIAPDNNNSEGIVMSAAQRIQASAGDRLVLSAGVDMGFSSPVLSLNSPGVVAGRATGTIGFFGNGGTNLQTVTGASTNATLVLNNLLNILGSLGLISKSTT